ncbi:MAG TPA: hypothetical protein VHX61_10985 [Rhizomicrobium sp.]|nr:hypothetical protein [Rhizomicrobium sp.]
MKIDPDGSKPTDGCAPRAGLHADAAANFYGTTMGGGGGYGGTVYKLARDRTETGAPCI